MIKELSIKELNEFYNSRKIVWDRIKDLTIAKSKRDNSKQQSANE